MYFKEYLNSFKVKKRFWYTLGIDFSFFFIFILAFTTFGNYIQQKSLILSGGKSPTEIQELMIASPEQAVVFLTQVKSLLLLAILGTIILVILAFLLYSLSRALIWNKLHHQKLTKKNYWKWNTLNLALIIPLLVIGLGFLIIRILFTLFLDFILKLNLRFYAAHTNVFDVITTLLEGTLSFFLVLLILIFIFLTYHLFIQKYKVWASIGKAFQLLKKKQRKIWRVVLFTLLTGLILTLITYPLKQYFLYNPVPTMLIQFGLSLLFVNWLRLYLFKTISLRH